MAEKPLKSIRFPGSEDVYKLKPDWGNIDNKPFNSSTSDTITRDQITESELEELNASGELIADMFMHVSDVVLTVDDLIKNGFSVTIDSEVSEFTTPEEVANAAIELTEGLLIILDGIFMSIGESMVGVDVEGLMFPKKGLYMHAQYLTIFNVSITVPGFDLVRSEKLNIDCLPDHLQFGDFPTGSDTLTWDGNTDGRYVFSYEIDTGSEKISVDMCHISNAVPRSIFIFNNEGMRLVIDDRVVEGNELQEGIQYKDDGYINIGLSLIVVPHNDYTISEEAGDITYPYAGIYYMKIGDAPVPTKVSLIIPGYTGFPTTKPMDVKYLPESHQFGDFPTGGDTLTWDGNTDGLESVDLTESLGFVYYKISDSTLTMNDFTNGAVVVTNAGFSITNEEAILAELDGLLAGADGLFLVVPENDFSADLGDGVIMNVAHKGIYAAIANEMHVAKMTIDGYTGFPSIKTLDKKYLPPLCRVYLNGDNYIYKDNFWREKMTRTELLSVIDDNRQIQVCAAFATETSFYNVYEMGVSDTYGYITVKEKKHYTAEYTSTT